MPTRFNQYISDATQCTPIMPLTHTCDSYTFRAIVESCQISTARCTVFGEMLIYFFYGRPAYRPSSWNVEAESPASAFLPCSFVLRSDAVSMPKRVAAFDTGAYEKGLYKKFLHPNMKKEDFLLDPSMEVPPRIVGRFYGSNGNYYFGNPISIVIPPLEFEVQSYYDIIRHAGHASIDDRGSAIEIQSDQSLSLTSDNVIFVVLPKVFLDEKLIQETIINRWKVIPGHYSVYPGDPKEFMGNVYQEIARFLLDRKYIQT